MPFELSTRPVSIPVISHLEFPCNVVVAFTDFAVDQNSLTVRRLPVCNNWWSFKKFS